MYKIVLILASAALVTGCEQPRLSGSANPEAGQFTIVQAGRRTMLLDTGKGRAWELLENQNGTSRGWAPVQSLP